MRPPTRRLAAAWSWLALAAALLATLLVYLPGLAGGFVFDDFANLADNGAFAPDALHRHFWAAVWSGQAGPLDRPLSNLSFAAQIALTGMAPAALKLANLLLHLGNGVLVWLLARRVLGWDAAERRGLFAPDTLAVAVAAAWLLAPVQLTAVLYVVQREESLAACFTLLGLLGYWHGRMLLLRGARAAWPWIWGSLLLGTVVGALAKETGVLLPAYAAVLEVFVLRGAAPAGQRRGLWVVFTALLLVPGALGLAWLLPGVIDGTSYGGRGFTAAQRLLTEGRVMVGYLRAIVLPDPNALSLYHDDYLVSHGWLRPASTLASWAALALLGLGAWLLRRRRPLLAFGVAWFFCGQSLVSTIVPLDLVYDHRNYLPSLGVLIALAGLVGAWVPARERASRRRLLGLGLAGVIVLDAGITLMRAQVWAHPERLAAFEAALHPASPRANYDFARLLLVSARDADDARFARGTALAERTAALPGAPLQALQALVFMNARFGRPVDPAWWDAMRRNVATRQLGSDDIGALYSLIRCGYDGTCRYGAADLQAFGGVLAVASRRAPERADLLTLRANFELNLMHQPTPAYMLMLRAVALDPERFSYWNNLAMLQVAAGLRGPATATLARMRELDRFGLYRADIDALQRRLDARPRGAGA